MNDSVQTWHYGVMARHWAENNTTGPEIAYFQKCIQRYGQPSLDTGCGTGRLLIPFLRAGLDVDGCDVSADMLAYCRSTAQSDGLHPNLYQQPLHALDLPRRYQTIVACGVFGIGVSRDLDMEALRRFHHHLLPGGVLLLEQHMPYANSNVWPLWRKDARQHLPELWPDYVLQAPDPGEEYALHYRLVAVDPLKQQTIGEMRLLEFKAGEIMSDVIHTLTSNYYFRPELQMMLEAVGFHIENVMGSWNDTEATANDDVIVFIARK